MALRTRKFTEQEIQYFRSLARGQAPLRIVQRAYMVWLSAQGKRVPAIAREVGVSEHTVRVWLTRFSKFGVDGLNDLPRPGAERKYTDEHVAEICRVAEAGPAPFGLGFDCWTLDRLVAYLHAERGITVRRSRLDEILRAAGVDWQAGRLQSAVSAERAAPRSGDPVRRDDQSRCSRANRRARAGQTVRQSLGLGRTAEPAAPRS
jgi:transposase